MSDTTPADTLDGDLRQHIFRTWAAVHPAERQLSHWVMNREWLNECRRLDDSRGALYQPGMRVSAPEYLLGIPVKIRDDGGPPHLEPDPNVRAI